MKRGIGEARATRETRDARREGLSLSRLPPPVASVRLTAKIKKSARCLERHICIVV